MASLDISTKYTRNLYWPFSNSSQTLKRIGCFTLWSHDHSNNKIKDSTKKRKLQTNIFDEYRWKNSQQNSSKRNPTTYKKEHMPRPSVIHPKVTRIVQCLQIISVIHHINQRQKLHDHLNRGIKKHLIKFNTGSWLKKKEKNSYQSRYRGNITQHNKSYSYPQPI